MENDVKNQIKLLIEKISENLDVSDSLYEKAENRYLSVGKWLNRKESTLLDFFPEIYLQGSFKLGTVIKPINDKEEYDIDLVCVLKIHKNKVSQNILKDLIGKEIIDYSSANNMKNAPENNRRCWTLEYSDTEQFHLDILPAVPDGIAFKILLEAKGINKNDFTESAIAITDKKHFNFNNISDDWPQSNPKGYANWFKSRMKNQFETKLKLLSESRKISIERIPDYSIKTPLQRVVQILKRHRDVMFNGSDEKPISVIISTLAGHAYNNEEDILTALNNVVNKMETFIEYNDGKYLILNPVNPLENFADKWEESVNKKNNFLKWLKQIKKDFGTLTSQTDVKILSESLKASIGENIVSKSIDHISKQTHTYKMLDRLIAERNINFNVPHKENLKWSINITNNVTLRCYVNNGVFPQGELLNDSLPPISKKLNLTFEATTDVIEPYDVYWQVVNTGHEAEQDGSLRGGLFKNDLGKNKLIREETTLYSGRHWVECFIIKNNLCVAKSGEFIVNIN